MTQMKIDCIIPARGGSKGVPRKNLQKVGELTLLARAIYAAKESQFTDEIYVSTDDQEIFEEAQECGAIAIRRPSELATDEAITPPVIQHALTQIDPPKAVIVIQCTAYPHNSRTIDKTVSALVDNDADCALSARREQLYLFRKGIGGYAVPVNWDMPQRRQEAIHEWYFTAAVSVTYVDWLWQTGHLLGGRTVLADDETTLIDIDTETDLMIARAIHEFRNQPRSVDMACVGIGTRYSAVP